MLKFNFLNGIINVIYFLGMFIRPLVNILICIFFLGLVSGSLIKKDTTAYLLNSQVYDKWLILLVSTDKRGENEALLSTQWLTEKIIPIASAEEKENFPKEFIKMFPENFTIKEIVVTYIFQNAPSQAETLRYKYLDTLNIRRFWQRTEFARILNKIKITPAPEIAVSIKGWKDFICTTEFDDPLNEKNALYKLQISLLPGMNEIYFSPDKSKLNSKLFKTEFMSEPKPVIDRDMKFHNSDIEQSCTSCHDGLPSSNEGESMNADCSVCHKGLVSGTKVHGPVELKECFSCHTWNRAKNAMIIEKGVPEICYDCHTEKKITVEESAYPHAVASDCMLCHLPHSSNDKAMLRLSINELCLTCHPDYSRNHPVQNHPIRFKFITKNGKEEITCSSCHNPHGSENKKLSRVTGGRMAMCLNCHNK